MGSGRLPGVGRRRWAELGGRLWASLWLLGCRPFWSRAVGLVGSRAGEVGPVGLEERKGKDGRQAGLRPLTVALLCSEPTGASLWEGRRGAGPSSAIPQAGPGAVPQPASSSHVQGRKEQKGAPGGVSIVWLLASPLAPGLWALSCQQGGPGPETGRVAWPWSSVWLLVSRGRCGASWWSPWEGAALSWKPSGQELGLLSWGPGPIDPARGALWTILLPPPPRLSPKARRPCPGTASLHLSHPLSFGGAEPCAKPVQSSLH